MVKLDSKWIAACIYRLLAVIPCWSCTQLLSIQIKEHQCGCIKAVVVMKPRLHYIAYEFSVTFVGEFMCYRSMI